MRRGKNFFEDTDINKVIRFFSIMLLISIAIFLIIFTIYNKRVEKDNSSRVIELGLVNSIVPNNTVSTSSTQDKGKEAATNELENKNEVVNTPQKEKSVVKDNKVNTSDLESKETDIKEDLSFITPVSGEIIRDFADDTLIYSNTLEEWTTHLGIDIAANKTSIVVAAEKGKIETIKTDPRYGLTITIDHGSGFKTIYSNLLTTEFVKVGDEVDKGQTIATVGDTASFEVLDEPHLHFEMTKDGEFVNPTIYFN